MEAVKKCWCSCFSERVMSHRLECGMPTTGVRMAVVVQVGRGCYNTQILNFPPPNMEILF